MKTKFIFVTGGVVSSLGKGINASSIGRLLKNRGLKVFMQKFDPYINVDPGNMSPLQHGEVYVTDDGAETDLDLGHYERFIDERHNKYSSVTSGKVYMAVLDNERAGRYNGGTVQVIPHITNEIKSRLHNAAISSGADVVITEIGGTVGDIEGLPFLEAIRQYRRDIGYANTYYIHNTLVPYVSASKELKTKPTQHSVKELRSIGINPDMIILRTERSIDLATKEKIALFCDVDKEAVIEAKDAKSIYEIPLKFAEQRVDEIICKHFKLNTNPLDLDDWKIMVKNMQRKLPILNIALVGQHTDLKDSYISVLESLKHAGYANNYELNIEAVKTSLIDDEKLVELGKYDGVVIPDGCADGNSKGLINAIKYARENNIPYFGIGYGMQLALIEYAMNVLGFADANSKELKMDAKMPLFVPVKDMQNNKNMRIGLYECNLKEASYVSKIYNDCTIKERYRHQYEFNNEYKNIFENTNLVFSGISSDKDTVEIIELNNHPFFIACQYHPEFLSRPNRAHPLFLEFIRVATLQKK